MRATELPGLKVSKSLGKDRFRTVDKKGPNNHRDTSYADERMSFIQQPMDAVTSSYNQGSLDYSDLD
jgi:hypothetical protein